jgi:RHS repeat-associated protein
VSFTYGFTAFGIAVQNSGSGTPATPFLYGGEMGYQWDRANWMYVGQWELDADNSRWVSRDTIGMAGGVNELAYCGNNPETNIDPNGLRTLTFVDRLRLKKIADYAAAHLSNCEPIVKTSQKRKAIAQITAAIIAVKQGQPDPPSLQAVFYAIDALNWSAYGDAGNLKGLSGVSPNLGGTGHHKCNYLTGYAYARGAGIGFAGRAAYPVTKTHRGIYPLGADNMGDRNQRVPNFPIVPKPQVGDIACWHGHLGLCLGDHLVIYASTFDVKINTEYYVASQRSDSALPFYRRYTPPTPPPVNTPVGGTVGSPNP